MFFLELNDTLDITHRNPPTSRTQYSSTDQQEYNRFADYIPDSIPDPIPDPTAATTTTNNNNNHHVVNFHTNVTKQPLHDDTFSSCNTTPKKHKRKTYYKHIHSTPYTIIEDCESTDNEVDPLTTRKDSTFNYTFSTINTTTGDTTTTGYGSDSFGGYTEYKGNCKNESGIHGYKKSLPIDIPRPIIKPVIYHL